VRISRRMMSYYAFFVMRRRTPSQSASGERLFSRE
jgi:hypothetical protein